MNTSKLWSTISLMIIMTACGSADESEVSPPENEVIDMHNARIALDYYGTYMGVLPCADCAGIETQIQLISDGDQYIKRYTYLGKSDSRVYSSSGTFEWHDDGSTITLVGSEEPNQYFVREGALQKLDEDGKRITGSLADRYIMQLIIPEEN